LPAWEYFYGNIFMSYKRKVGNGAYNTKHRMFLRLYKEEGGYERFLEDRNKRLEEQEYRAFNWNGIRFRSNLEVAYAKYLESQRLAGVILKWDYEAVNFELGSIEFDRYRPDFLVTRNAIAKKEIHETKGNLRRKDVRKGFSKFARFATRFQRKYRFFLVTCDNDGAFRLTEYPRQKQELSINARS
jgi:hypothetical protein